VQLRVATLPHVLQHTTQEALISEQKSMLEYMIQQQEIAKRAALAEKWVWGVVLKVWTCMLVYLSDAWAKTSTI
jgi:hypothetical protein